MRSVIFFVFTIGGEEIRFKDSVKPNSASSALAQFTAKQTIHAVDIHDDEVYIPYHAIVMAMVGYEYDIEAPIDDLCGGASEKPICDAEECKYHLADNDERTSICPAGEEYAHYSHSDYWYTLYDENDNQINNYTLTVGDTSIFTTNIVDGSFQIVQVGDPNQTTYIDVDIPGADCIPRFYFYIDS